jgi:predicted enzyme related to lactoylglutathione lyase
MAHFSRLFKVVIDIPADDYDREVSFWAAALGEPLLQPFARHPEYHGAALHGQDFWLLTQRLGEGTAHVHLDIHTDDLDAEVARLEDLGARRVQRVDSWQVMRDPASLLFCILPDPPGTLHEGNAHHWP